MKPEELKMSLSYTLSKLRYDNGMYQVNSTTCAIVNQSSNQPAVQAMTGQFSVELLWFILPRSPGAKPAISAGSLCVTAFHPPGGYPHSIPAAIFQKTHKDKIEGHLHGFVSNRHTSSHNILYLKMAAMGFSPRSVLDLQIMPS